MPPQTNASHKTNNQPVILSGENCEAICVVEILPSESEVKSRCVAPQGYGSKSRWLSKGDVTFFVTSHPNSKPYPIVAFAPRFCSVYHFAKLRLRKPQAVFSAQNDIQSIDFAIPVRNNGQKVNRPYKVSSCNVLFI